MFFLPIFVSPTDFTATEDNIDTATGNVGGYRDGAEPACLANNFGFLVVIFGVKHAVREIFALEIFTNNLVIVDTFGTN